MHAPCTEESEWCFKSVPGMFACYTCLQVLFGNNGELAVTHRLARHDVGHSHSSKGFLIYDHVSRLEAGGCTHAPALPSNLNHLDTWCGLGGFGADLVLHHHNVVNGIYKSLETFKAQIMMPVRAGSLRERLVR